MNIYVWVIYELHDKNLFQNPSGILNQNIQEQNLRICAVIKLGRVNQCVPQLGNHICSLVLQQALLSPHYMLSNTVSQIIPKIRSLNQHTFYIIVTIEQKD